MPVQEDPVPHHRGTHRHAPVLVSRSEAESHPHLIIVRNGALDERELLAPGATIWTKSAPESAWIDESLPHHDGQPPAPPRLTD